MERSEHAGPARRPRRAVIGMGAAGLLVAGLIAFAVGRPAPSAAACGVGGTGTPGGRSSALFGVDAVSRSNAWAVGFVNSQGADRTLAMHWDGARWRRVRTPSPGGSCAQDRLYAVAVRAPWDVWAVGTSLGATSQAAIVLHWDGRAWAQVPSPDPGRFDALTGVAATARTDAWAVGRTSNGGGSGRTFVLHWDGGAWVRVASPNPGPGSRKDDGLSSVSALTASNAWAAGRRHGSDGERPVLLHWNGSRWRNRSRVGARKGGMSGVDLLSRKHAWAVGETADLRTWTVRWNGRRWVTEPSPNPSGGPGSANYLSDVSGAGAGDVWAVGDSVGGRRAKTLVLRWNGRTWTQVTSPSPGFSFSYLTDVSAVSRSEAWAVGAADGFGSSSRMLILHWSGGRWHAAALPPDTATPGSGDIPYLALGALLLLLVAALARGLAAVAPRRREPSAERP